MKRLAVLAVAAAAATAGCGTPPDPNVCADARTMEGVVMDAPNLRTDRYEEEGNVRQEMLSDAREVGANEGCAGFDSDDADAD
jgi:hypothetical protein